MSTYPIKVHAQSYEHHGGTKAYHLMIIETADNRAVVVNRWGKKGAFGELQARTFVDIGLAWKFYERKENEKIRGGYSPSTEAVNREAPGQSSLVKAISIPVFNKIGREAVLHLDPSFPASGLRMLDPPRVGEDGRLTGQDRPRQADLTEAIKEQQRAERAEIEKAYESNPLFGMF